MTSDYFQEGIWDLKGALIERVSSQYSGDRILDPASLTSEEITQAYALLEEKDQHFLDLNLGVRDPTNFDSRESSTRKTRGIGKLGEYLGQSKYHIRERKRVALDNLIALINPLQG